ncbi:hypothetical protein SDC9_120512 [bioreactor metagenome]|uniref:Uncharacterized protein n=1 Tax=bioreactor metagenome TaxID=1076179 RepID=A0A645C709_9ZZZZ
MVVPGMSQLMSQGGDPSIRVVEVGQDPALLCQGEGRIIGSPHLALAASCINPTLLESLIGKGPHLGREDSELLDDECVSFLIAIAALLAADGSEEVIESTTFHLQVSSLVLEIGTE